MRPDPRHSLRILAHQYRQLAAQCCMKGEPEYEEMHLRTAKLFQDELDRMEPTKPATPSDPFAGFRD